MKKCTWLILMICFFASCKVAYQTNSLVGVGENYKKDDGNMITYEDSSLIIKYRFENNTLHYLNIFYSIYNKSGNPIVINWSKTAFIYNNKTYPLDKVNINSNSSFNSTEYRPIFPSDNKNISGTASINSVVSSNMSFIPPKVTLDCTPYQQSIAFVSNIKSTTTDNNEIIRLSNDPSNGSNDFGKIYKYDANNSPFLIQFYFTYNIVEEGKTKGAEKLLENSFYVNKIIELDKNPQRIQNLNEDSEVHFATVHHDS